MSKTCISVRARLSFPRKRESIFLIIAFIFIFTACAKEVVKRPEVKKKKPQVEEQARKPIVPPTVYTPQRKASDRIVAKGKVQLENGNHEQALQLFQDAVNVDSANGQAYYYLALAHIKLDQNDAALGLLDKAEALLQHEPDWLEKIQDLRQKIGGAATQKPVYYQRVNDQEEDEF
ncbi:MAG: tetratricopeptide repeat protein [Pseudomonadota bacterium]